MELNTYMMDNEVSNILKDKLIDTEIKYQLAPPHNYKIDISEQAIQTFKGHFKAGLALLDPDFPISEWDRLVEQGELILDLLLASRTNPKLSAFVYLLGNLITAQHL